jgi:hypothetical protein
MTKQLLGKIILFFALFFLIDNLLGSFIERYGLSHNERSVRNIYQQKEKLDILFVGSSHTYSAIDPQVFAESKIKTMNLGLATAGPIYYTYMIRAFLAHNEKPGKIVIQTNYQDFTDKSDNISYGYFIYLDIWNRLAYYVEKKDFKSFLTSLSRTYLNRDIFSSAIDVYFGKKEKAKWDNGFIYTEGSLEDNRTMADSLELYHSYFKDDPNHLLEEKFKIFSNMLSSLKKSGIDVIIIDLPEYHLLKDDSSYQPLRTRFVKKMVAITSQYGYPFIDFNVAESCEDLRKNKRLFRDVDHMNWHGGKIFSRILMDTLGKPL